jgi:hypothetical protein
MVKQPIDAPWAMARGERVVLHDDRKPAHSGPAPTADKKPAERCAAAAAPVEPRMGAARKHPCGSLALPLNSSRK